MINVSTGVEIMSRVNILSPTSQIFGMVARAFSYIGGGLVIVLAYSVFVTGMSVQFISIGRLTF